MPRIELTKDQVVKMQTLAAAFDIHVHTLWVAMLTAGKNMTTDDTLHYGTIARDELVQLGVDYGKE